VSAAKLHVKQLFKKERVQTDVFYFGLEDILGNSKRLSLFDFSSQCVKT
jgi:hypothetical protein